MRRVTFRCDAALDSVKDISDSAQRELYIARHELVDLIIETQHADAWRLFNALPTTVLPRLPHGYRWARSEEYYTVIRDKTAEKHELTLVVYGPDTKNRINYIFQVDKVTTFGFGHTRTTKEPPYRAPPMTVDHYCVRGFDYTGHGFKKHVRGHIIDHKDTIQERLPKSVWSTYDSRNYIPEPPDYDWGLGTRKSKVAEIRGDSGAYSQFMEYSAEPEVTVDDTPVPDKIYFTAYSYNSPNKYQIDGDIFHVDFTEDLSRPSKNIKYLDHAKSAFTIDSRAAPIVVLYSPDSTNRALRLDRRDSMRKATEIADGSIRSRYPDRDGEYAHCDGADIEVAGVSQRINAGNFVNSNGNSDLGVKYVKRALFFGHKQLELDGNDPVIDKSAKLAGRSFFKNYKGDEDLDGLSDRFRQLLADQKVFK